MDSIVDQLGTVLAARPVRLATVGVLVVLALATARALRRLLRRLESGGHLTAGMGARLRSLVAWSVGAVVVLVSLQMLGAFDHAWAFLSAALATVAIGFVATWSILSNATSALLLLALRPFRIGDRVALIEPASPDKQIAGRVVDMNLLYTTLEQKNDDGALSTVHVPNNLFMQKLLRTEGPEPRQPSPFFTGAPPPGSDPN